MDSQRSNSRQHEHKFISLPLSTILFKTHLTLRTHLSLSKHFVACGVGNKKKTLKTARERFLKMFILVYMHFSLLLIKEGWKRRAEFFLLVIMQLRPRLFEGFFYFQRPWCTVVRCFIFFVSLLLPWHLIILLLKSFLKEHKRMRGFFST